MARIKYHEHELQNLIDTIEKLIVAKEYINAEIALDSEPLTLENFMWKLRKEGIMGHSIGIEINHIVENICNSDEYKSTVKTASEKNNFMLEPNSLWHEARIDIIYSEYMQYHERHNTIPNSKELFIKKLKGRGIYYTIKPGDLFLDSNPLTETKEQQ